MAVSGKGQYPVALGLLLRNRYRGESPLVKDSPDEISDDLYTDWLFEAAAAGATGSLAANESGADAFSGAGDVLVQGTLAAAESGADTFAADGTAGSGAITGTLAASESGADTFAASGVVVADAPPAQGGGGGRGLAGGIAKPQDIERIARYLAQTFGREAQTAKAASKKAKRLRKMAATAERVAEISAAPAETLADLTRDAEAFRGFLLMMQQHMHDTRAQAEAQALYELISARLQDEEEAIFVLLA